MSTTQHSRARSLFAAILAPCGAFEWIALFYLAVSGALMLIFRASLSHPAKQISEHFSVLAAILLVVNVGDRAVRGPRGRTVGARTLRVLREWYPQLVFLFCFEELQILVHLIFPVWRDSLLIAFDYRLTGVNPAAWLSQFSSFWLNETMQAAYMTYFFFLGILTIALYRRRTRPANSPPVHDPAGAPALRAYWTVLTASMVAYAIGYVISIFFPVEAPFFAMRSFNLPPLTGGAATSVINFIEAWGRVRGGAFPSAHVSGSFVALIGAWRYRRYLFWIYLPLFIAMCVSTIYCRYHYIADVFAGILVGSIGVILADRLMSLSGADPSPRLYPSS